MRSFLLPAVALLGLMQGAVAQDYTTFFDPGTMTVGQKLGEYLEVREYCPKSSCTAAEKLKYVTSLSGRTGRIEFPVNSGNDFEMSFNIRSSSGSSCGVELTITLYLTDNTYLPLDINNCNVYYPNGNARLSFVSGMNDFRLIAEQSVLKISANDIFANVKFNLDSPTINRVVISKITQEDQLFEIRTRGIQKAGSTTCSQPPASTTTPNNTNANSPNTSSSSDLNTACFALYDPIAGELTVPCVAVPVIQAFGGVEFRAYSVQLKQRSNTFVFDLSLDKIQQIK